MTEHFVILMIRLIMKEFKELNSLIVHSASRCVSVNAASINVGDGNCAYAGEDYYKFINGFNL